MEDIRQTKEWAGYLRSSGWIVKKMGRVYVFIKRIPLSPFSMMKIQRFSGKLNFKALKEIRKKYWVVYVVAEPMEEMVEGWRVNKSPFLPTKTVLVDLRKSEKELWNDLSTNAKRILKKLNSSSCHPDWSLDSYRERNRGIPFNCKSTSHRDPSTRRLGRDDRDRFYKAWKESSKTWIMNEERFSKLLDAFPKKASLWVSEDNSEIVSGVLLLNSKDAVNYFQTFTSKRGRDTGTHYKLVWEVMLKSKREGFRYFDFEGVLDKRWPMKKWAGFSEFKNKFGGEMVSYPGSFVRWF